MKHRILTVFAALMCLCLYLVFSLPAHQGAKLAWINMDWLVGRNNFYLKKRQWLADARTIVEGIRFLYESSTTSQIDPTDVAGTPHTLLPRAADSTNLNWIERPES